jgi:F-type H+-transporting ATPase subunit b
MRRFAGLVAVCAISLCAPVFAQTGESQEAVEQHEGQASPEGGGYGPGADIHEDHAEGIINWWSWDRGPNAKDPTHRNWPPPFGYAIINFLVFIGVMGKLAWKPLVQFMANRHDDIAKDLREAAELRRLAELELQKYQAKVSNIDAEIDALLKQIHAESEKEKARIIALAEADAKRLKLDAERQIANEIEAARRELRRGVIEAAVAAADQVLRKNVGADDQRKMAEHYVSEVEHQAKVGRPS